MKIDQDLVDFHGKFAQRWNVLLPATQSREPSGEPRSWCSPARALGVRPGVVRHYLDVLGGERSGGKRGRGAPAKPPFVARVVSNEKGHPLRMKLTVVEGFRTNEIVAWAHRNLGGVRWFGLLPWRHRGGLCSSQDCRGKREGQRRAPEFRWVNTILGNIKSALRGTYHAIRPKCAQRFLSEFEYRFNRRFDLPDIIPRLAHVALRTPSMPERLLKLNLA